MEEQQDLAVSILSEAPRTGEGPEPPRAALRSAFQATFSQALAASLTGTSIAPRVQIARAAAAAGRTVDVEEYGRRLNELVARTPFHVAEGAASLLETLRARGYRTALVSNTTGETGEALRPVLRRLGLERSLDHLFFSDELPWTKPAPQIFFQALQAVGTVPERTVHVGDGWVDIEGARRAGLRAGILFTGLQRYGKTYASLYAHKGPRPSETPYRAARLSEVPGLLEGLIPPGR